MSASHSGHSNEEAFLADRERLKTQFPEKDTWVAYLEGKLALSAPGKEKIMQALSEAGLRDKGPYIRSLHEDRLVRIPGGLLKPS